MIIEIKNLGYVKNVKVNLNKDLIVLCGPNNTGKTYVAYAIYGLMKHRYLETSIRSFSNAVEGLSEKGEIEIDLAKLLRSKGSEHLKRITTAYKDFLPNVFASSKSIFDNTEIIGHLGDVSFFEKKILESNIFRQIGFPGQVSVRFSKPNGSSILKCALISGQNGNSNRKDGSLEFVSEVVSEGIQNLYLDFFFSNPYIATAERVAINLFSKELSVKRNALVDKLLELKDEGRHEDPFDLMRRRATRYPLPIRDSLEIAEDLANFKKQTSKFEAFADELEADILKGKVVISKEGEVQFKPDTNKRVTLPIHLSASVVKSLSNLVIYFRHLATENDLIILDEPEMNLHPDNQIIVARIIGKMVNKGFKVIVNTHSDYIIRELNNLIMLSSKVNYLEKLGYSKSETLKPEQVDAILFHYEKRKVETLKVTETGFEVDTIDDVINELNSRSQSLYFDTLA
jgi:energy-coupling factor transporter ATP-binding protein EcfA2